jgi:hypothetical protein
MTRPRLEALPFRFLGPALTLRFGRNPSCEPSHSTLPRVLSIGWTGEVLMMAHMALVPIERTPVSAPESPIQKTADSAMKIIGEYPGVGETSPP